ncbi:hypothetical protein AB0O34_32125 [Sphaerisporangium sp. NPDC088356]|uniref:hypothetical protein n=1 Tax=Sphaerisporangium sp. NPDC088356 TaxID=3154871 RepID=UPI0034151988
MPTGRHAGGRTGEQIVRRQDWDPEARAAARLLDTCEPAWTVFYGVWSRRYYAIAHRQARVPLIVDAPLLAELRELMREAELPDLAGEAHFVAV